MLSEPHPLFFPLPLFSHSSQTATGFAWMGCGTQNAAMGSIDSPAWPGPPKRMREATQQPTTSWPTWSRLKSSLVQVASLYQTGFLSVLVGAKSLVLGPRTMIIIARGKKKEN
ncbi:hypothetical protein PgNI_10529 [Pyricularia grisea]|uniref:Uncharacterized protein n=1 Tax=Pyricularia grisea TaxID=148305 RepID=A0A6P8AYJ7_PYRGI|nr:hypothetical protein PgNI_10529 [Pyricularia grisea]TLD07433.1 hypothetical protein PgNI_10529 [Pyricularia grisea]